MYRREKKRCVQGSNTTRKKTDVKKKLQKTIKREIRLELHVLLFLLFYHFLHLALPESFRAEILFLREI